MMLCLCIKFMELGNLGLQSIPTLSGIITLKTCPKEENINTASYSISHYHLHLLELLSPWSIEY